MGHVYNLKTVYGSNYWHFGGNRLLLLAKNALDKKFGQGPPPAPQFGKLVQLFSDVKIQDLKVNLELKRLYILYNILYIYNLKTVLSSNYWHFGGNRLLLLTKNAVMKR